MGVPHQSGNFGDLLDPRFQEIYHEQYPMLPDMVPLLYNTAPNNGRNDMRFSQVGAFEDLTQFDGQVTFDNVTQGFDTTATAIEWTSGFQVERALFDDDQYNIMDQRPRGLANAVARTRQKHGARAFNNFFTFDTFFFNNSEGVALGSNSHTTTAQDTSTASGFDNLVTTALSATAVASARIQMVGFRDDRANRISVVPDEILIPPDLYQTAFEIVASMGKVDTANNNRNVHEGAYKIIEWNYLTDTNNWFMMDSLLRRDAVMWWQRTADEFAFVEDFDTLTGKWRLYTRYSPIVIDWRWGLGASVS
jgi:hypothetical protein|tara:strand:+ start:7947 stop:8867 length:921 start_codon:yes stop_codon:yes gene_type:complete